MRGKFLLVSKVKLFALSFSSFPFVSEKKNIPVLLNEVPGTLYVIIVLKGL